VSSDYCEVHKVEEEWLKNVHEGGQKMSKFCECLMDDTWRLTEKIIITLSNSHISSSDSTAPRLITFNLTIANATVCTLHLLVTEKCKKSCGSVLMLTFCLPLSFLRSYSRWAGSPTKNLYYSNILGLINLQTEWYLPVASQSTTSKH